MRLHGDSRILWSILLGAFVVRVVFGIWWQARLPEGTRFFFGDSESYWELGQTIAAGEPYQFRTPDRKVFRTPGYPALLAPLFLIGGPDVSPVWGRIEGALFGTATVLAVWWLSRQIFKDRAALLAAACMAIYPEAIATSGFLLAESPFIVAMLMHLGFWLRSDRAGSWRAATGWACVAGSLAGAASLIRPGWLLFTPFAGGLLLLAGTGRIRRACLLATMCAGLTLVMIPWWIRNAVVTGHFVPTTLQVGASLYDGLNPVADGSSNMEPVAELAAAWRADRISRDPRQKGLPQDGTGARISRRHSGTTPETTCIEYQLDRALFAAAIAWARHNPGQAARLAVVKFQRMWNIGPNEPSLRAWPIRLLFAGTFVPILLLAGLAAWRYRKAGWPIGLCLLPAGYGTLLHILFVSSIRYRQPAVCLLIVLASGWLAGDRLAYAPRTCSGRTRDGASPFPWLGALATRPSRTFFSRKRGHLSSLI